MINSSSSSPLKSSSHLSISQAEPDESAIGEIPVRIVSIDFSYEEPLDCDIDALHSQLFPTVPLRRVPVVHVYGVTDRGQKICVHVHQLYPYLYIPYPLSDLSQVGEYARRLGVSINHALALALNRPTDPAKTQFVMGIVLVRAVDFYGYHKGMRYFLKVYLLDPYVLSRLAELLGAGAILGQPFQPYESHVPFILQFLIDYNLFGMNFMRLGWCRFRLPIWSRVDGGLSVPAGMRWSIRDNILRQSTCELEVDTWPWFIRNRLDIQERLLEPNSPVLDRVDKLVHSLNDICKSVSEGVSSSIPASTSISSSSSSAAVKPTYVKRVEEVIAGLLDGHSAGDKSDDSMLCEDVPTLFQSVTSLYPPQFLANDPRAVVSPTFCLSPTMPQQAEIEAVVDAHIISTQIPPEIMHNESDESDNEIDEQPAENANPEFSSDAAWEDSAVLNEVLEKVEAADDTRIDALLDEMSSAPSSSGIPQVDGAGDDDRPLYQGNALLKNLIGRLKAEPKPQGQHDFASSLSAMWSPIPETSRDIQPLFKSPPRPESPTRLSEIIEVAHDFPEVDMPDADALPQIRPPTRQELLTDPTLDLRIRYQEPFYSNRADIPSTPTYFAGRSMKVRGNGPADYPKLEKTRLPNSEPIDLTASQTGIDLTPPFPFKYVTITQKPPTRNQVIQKCSTDRAMPEIASSQIDGPSLPQVKPFHELDFDKPEKQHLSLCSLELHVNTRSGLNPDPNFDAISCLYFCFTEDDPKMLPLNNGLIEAHYVGCIMSMDSYADSKLAPGIETIIVRDEEEIINRLIEMIIQQDPDILCGWEVHCHSWGYLADRALIKYGVNAAIKLSRIVTGRNSFYDRDRDSWGMKQTSGIHIGGRIILNIWRLMKSEFAFTSYSYEKIAHHVLNERVPSWSYDTLAKWYSSSERWRTMDYYVARVQHNLMILDKCNFIVRTSEFARLQGIEFYSVISRGSQFKVESLMIRIAHPENLIMISPSRVQVEKMRALECIPLVMEPRSAFYSHPVLVLDFQSLYPSIMIAYNLCYSTCLGRLHPNIGETFGFRKFKVDADNLERYKDSVIVTPNGMVYVKPEIRQSTLRKMLADLLDTRVLVKKELKRKKDDPAAHRILDSKQLGIKLIANVTYGYTSASFSGRMPNCDVADSIVQTGRETLENAIRTINSNPKWKARVVYGDTDSIFVELPGRNKDQAFKIGNEMASVITALNPPPMKLKFEKVYLPCMLLTKKRYVGFKYEDPKQEDPEFDAKGIETVRRDGCPAVAKVMEASLKILFRTKDMSQLKQYLVAQFGKIMTGRISLQDFIIAKAVKLGTYSSRGLPPPGAFISLQKMKIDPKAEPQYGERVPFLITFCGPNARLVDAARTPLDFLQNSYSRLDAKYYITKQILPVLARVFDLIGVDVKQWYAEMPKIDRLLKLEVMDSWDSVAQSRHGNRNETMEKYYQSSNCVICRNPTTGTGSGISVCQKCRHNMSASSMKIHRQLQHCELKFSDIVRTCSNCIGSRASPDLVNLCISIDCPVFYERIKTGRNLRFLSDAAVKFDKLEW